MRRIALLSLLLACPLAAQEVRWQAHEFATRTGQRVEGAEIGSLQVPENHAQPEGRSIELAMLRLPSTSQNPGFPIIVLADEPGDSAIELASGGRFPLFQSLRAFGDVIAFDQRGGGQSVPSLRCEHRLDIPIDSAPSHADVLDHYRRRIESCSVHFREAGIDLSQYDTLARVDDLEFLRLALEVEKIRLLGMGHGSHLGLSMLRQYPDAVERIVLAGVQGPNHSLQLPSSLETGLDHVARLLAEDPATARLIPDLRGFLTDLIARLEEQPVTARTMDPDRGQEVEIVIGALDLRLLASAAVSTRELVTYLPYLFLPLAEGEFDGIAPFVLRMRRDDLELSRMLTDAASFASEDRLQRLAEERRTALLGGLFDLPLPELREVLGVPVLPESYREPVLSQVPTLFISGSLDARTPIRNAREVLVGLPRHEHVIVQGAGHDDSLLIGSPEILAAIEAFLRTDPPPNKRIELPPIEFVLPPASASVATRILIEGATVLHPSGDRWLEDHSILIHGDRIIRVDASDAFEVDSGLRRIDASGQFVIPGLHDMHVHLSKLRRPAIPLFVYHGVTSVRDLGGELDELRSWQRAIRSGELPGPRIKTVGAYFEHPDNIARMLRNKVVEPVERSRLGVRDPEHAREMVAALAAKGVDGIKMRTCIDAATYYAIGEAAAAAGLPFYGHADGLSPEQVLRAGQDSIEHGFIPPLAQRPAGEREALCREMAARGVALVPTLTVWEHSLFADLDEIRSLMLGESLGRHGLRPYLSAFALADWQEQLEERNPANLRMIRGLYPSYSQDVMSMKSAGMRILPGSDAAVLMIQPGASLHDELEIFVEKLEMSPAEAIRAATIECAEFLGSDRDLGSIVSGKLADLVILDEDPLVEIGHIRTVHAVLMGGRWYGPEERAALLDSILAMPELKENDWQLPERGQ